MDAVFLVKKTEKSGESLCLQNGVVITVLAADHSLQHEDEILVSEHLREVVCQIEQRSFVDSLTQQKHCVICVDLVHRLW